jgi:hypothetical protein
VDFSHGSTVHTYKMGFPTQTPSFWGGTKPNLCQTGTFDPSN